MRCPMCGKKMNQVEIDGVACLQCPRDTCRWVERLTQEAEAPAADVEPVKAEKK